ncbi:MAG: peptide deformylase [Clostridiales bacterium]|nr:peptide deformylase [Clostridiales bacterium]
MAIRNVVTEGDEILRKHCKEVKEVTPRIKETLQDMLETMRESMGVGIAAPQVGIMRRMFVAQPDPFDEDKVYFMINPVMLEMSEEKELGTEGCLSVPDMMGDVERSVWIKMEATDINGERKTYEFEGFDARVMQHEYDHLDGILYTDKCQNLREAEYAEDEEEEEAE